MAIGDEFGLTEDLYQKLIGRYVAAIEVLTQRLVAKDQHIAKIETENSLLDSKALQFETELVARKAEEDAARPTVHTAKTKTAPKEGDIYLGEQPPK